MRHRIVIRYVQVSILIVKLKKNYKSIFYSIFKVNCFAILAAMLCILTYI